MRIGISFPHQAIGPDQIGIRDCAQTAEQLGFDHMVILAKQAAEVDLLSGGRLRLGVGAGYIA